jgi:biopolymer transport protein ExbD
MRFRKKSARALDFELNLASVIDCLVVLIAFVLISASFVSIGILDGEVASTSAEASPAEKGPELAIKLTHDHGIEVTVEGTLQGKQAKREYFIREKRSDWNFSGLTDRLAFIKGEWPDLKSAILTADNGVEYKDVIKSMEITRLAVPAVLLGGP